MSYDVPEEKLIFCLFSRIKENKYNEEYFSSQELNINVINVRTEHGYSYYWPLIVD